LWVQILLNTLLGREPMPGPSSERAALTFLFANVEGSSERWERYPNAMADVLRQYDAIVRGTIRQHGGSVYKTLGDAVLSYAD
jgi:class 3 adenylate cyclase